MAQKAVENAGRRHALLRVVLLPATPLASGAGFHAKSGFALMPLGQLRKT
jgi:hypothetical protein